MKQQLEDYWRTIEKQWLTRAFPFSRNTFGDIVADILDNEYPPAEAVGKHIAEGSGIAPPKFTRFLVDRFGASMRREDAVEFVDGYGRLTMLLQVGFMLAVEGPIATEEALRQNPGPRTPFLRDNMREAAPLIRQDPTGRKMMTSFADAMTRGSKRSFFREGVLTAHDTFMAYSKCFEGFDKGELA